MTILRRRNGVVLLICLAVLVLSVPFVKLEKAQRMLPLNVLKTKPSPPPENHFPTAEQKLTYGASNVWESINDTDIAPSEVLDDAANKVFVLLKTGAETMWCRIPVHFDTSLKRFPHNAIYSDMAARINGHFVLDVLQYLPEWALNSAALLGYRVRRTGVDEHWGWGPSKLAIDGEGGGWQIDRYKNIPAFIDAWRVTDGQAPWYFMIDGDTYMVSTSFAAAIKDRDPDSIWYLGHAVGLNPMFAHGGSGILLSRGAMRAMFKEPNNTAWHEEMIDDACKRAVYDCCGDSIVAYEFERMTGEVAEKNLEIKENGLFQGHPKTGIRLDPTMWCTPVGTFHHVNAWEIQELFEWERVATARKAAKGESTTLTYADFYEDFVEPFLAERRSGWYFKEGNGALMAEMYEPDSTNEVWDDEVKLDPVGLEEHCRRACELNSTCLSWEWRKDIKCRIFLGEFSLGLALNPYNPAWEAGTTEVVAGHMVERINSFHRNSPCRNPASSPTMTTISTATSAPTYHEPGWFNKLTEKDLMNGPLINELHSRPLFK